MFNVEELILEAAAAEGSQIAQVVNKDGTPNRQKVNTLIPLINSALDEIYKRFVVENLYINIKTQKGVRDYVIDPMYRVGVSNDPYILDADFESPVIAITSLADLWGRSLSLNQATKKVSNPHAVINTVSYGSPQFDVVHQKFSTPKYNVLRIPQDLEPTELILGIRTSHKRIPLIPDDELNTFDLSDLVIELPLSYRTAIVYFVFSRLMNVKGAAGIGRAMFHEGDNYYSKFLKECDALRQTDSEVAEQIDYDNCYQRTGFI